jgi:phage head maturation protease
MTDIATPLPPFEDVIRSLEVADLDIQRTVQGRTVIARALTYGMPYRVTDDGRKFYNERWRAGVFDKSITQRSAPMSAERVLADRRGIPLQVLHDGSRLPVGAMIGVEPDRAAFIFRAKVYNSDEGDLALEMIEDGVLTGVSVGARILNQQRTHDGVERIEAKLNEISLAPAYLSQMSDGLVLAVRALITDPEAIVEPQGPVATPALDDARNFLTNLTKP